MTVIVCAYTVERWDSLVAGIRSLCGQTALPQEVVLVVDHSPELLTRATEQLPGEMPGIRIVANHGPRGLSGARNIGVSISQSEIVAFLDDDAIAEPEWIEQLTGPYRDAAVMATGAQCDLSGRRAAPGGFPGSSTGS